MKLFNYLTSKLTSWINPKIDIKARLAQGKIYAFHGGLNIETGKELSSQATIKSFPLLSHYTVPLLQHRGTVGKLLVRVGQQLSAGQALTEPLLEQDLPVHSPVAGTVVSIIDDYQLATGELVPVVIIKTAPQQEQHPYFAALDLNQATPWEIYQRIKDAGIAGLGGAAFPSHLKIKSSRDYQRLQNPTIVDPNKAHSLIVNGIECEPYITCDDLLARNYPAEIVYGVQVLMTMLDLELAIIAIEDNKPQAIKAIQQYLKTQQFDNILVRVLPTLYPQGSSKILFQSLTGYLLQANQQTTDFGVYLYNLATVYAIAQAIKGYSLTERLVTITGDAVTEPANYWIKFGTPLNQIAQLLKISDYDKIIMGGPMMGHLIVNQQGPTLKGANCFIFDKQQLSIPAQENSCIRCSACQNHCPVNLQPQLLYWYENNYLESQKLDAMSCIECGLCDYVCPSKIPLVKAIKNSKQTIIDNKLKEQLQNISKERYEIRNQRLEEKARLAKEKAIQAAKERREQTTLTSGEDPVAAALARLKAKSQQTTPPAADDNAKIMQERKERRLAKQQAAQETVVDEKQDKIAAARARAIAIAKAKQAQATQATVSAESPATPDNAKIMQERKERRLAKQQAAQETVVDEKQDKIAAARARAIAIAKAKQAQAKAAQQDKPEA